MFPFKFGQVEVASKYFHNQKVTDTFNEEEEQEQEDTVKVVKDARELNVPCNNYENETRTYKSNHWDTDQVQVASLELTSEYTKNV